MEIAFANFQLRNEFESRRRLKKKYGDVLAKDLMQLVADLRAAEFFSDFRKLGCDVTPTPTDEFLLEICQQLSIRFKPNHVKNPMNSDGSLDLDRIQYIQITGINYDQL